MGGEKEDKKKVSDTYCLDTETWNWRKLFIFEPPKPRYKHSITKIEKSQSVFMFGGFTTKNMNDLWELDLSCISHKGKGDIPGAVWNVLTQKGDVPCERRGHTLIKIPGKNQLVLYGGYTINEDGEDQKEDNDFYILDIQEVTWSKLKLEGIYPEPRALQYITFFSPTDLIVLGGIQTEFEESEKEESIKFLTNVYLVNLPEKIIIQSVINNNYPCPKHNHICGIAKSSDSPKTLIFGNIESKFI